MLKKIHNLLSCFGGEPSGTSYGEFDDVSIRPNRLVFAFGVEAKGDAAPEGAEGAKKEFKAVDVFDPKKEWNSQIMDLVERAMGDEYHSFVDRQVFEYIKTDRDFQKFQERYDDIRSMELKQGDLSFYDVENKLVATFEIARALREVVLNVHEHARGICTRHSKKERLDVAAQATGDRNFLSFLQTRKKDDGEKDGGQSERADTGGEAAAAGPAGVGGDVISLPPRPPLSPEERKANEELARLAEAKKDRRAQLLYFGIKNERNGVDTLVNIDPRLGDVEADAFERNWRFMDYSHQIDELLSRDARREEGYTVNPFKTFEWNKDTQSFTAGNQWFTHETLRELVQDGYNDRLYFSDVAGVVYTDRYDQLKTEWMKSGIDKEAFDLLEDDYIVVKKSFTNDGEELVKSHENLKKLAEKLNGYSDEKDVPKDIRKLYKHRESIQNMAKMLGDFVVYSMRLVNMVAKLRYRTAAATRDRDLGMKEFAKDDEGRAILDESPEGKANRVKAALQTVFTEDFQSPEEYTSELSQIFCSGKGRELTFQDLHGNTASVEQEWFSEVQSGDTAYNMALTEIAEQKQKSDGTWENVIEEPKAVNHLNNLIQLGITAYDAMPGNRSLEAVIDGLHHAGAKTSDGEIIYYSGDEDDDGDVRRLFDVLAIHDLNDIDDNDGTTKARIQKERLQFLRIGSTIWQKNKAQLQEQKEKQKEAPGVTIKLTPEQADEILYNSPSALIKTKKFSDGELAKIKQTLVGGVLASVTIPEGKVGAAAYVKYELGRGVSLTFTAGMPEWGSFAAGLGLGKSVELTKDLEVSVNVGAGVASGGLVGVVGAGINYKFNSVISAQGGVGFVFGPMVPVAYGMLTFKTFDAKEEYKEKLTQAHVQHHIEELDRSGDPYEAVKANPDKYPSFRKLLTQVNNLPLEEASKKATFNSLYEAFKENLQRGAIDDSIPKWYETVQDFSIGVGMAGPVPFPIIAVSFRCWPSRKVVYRLASEEERVQKIAEDKARAAILGELGPETTLESQVIKTSGDIVWDPETEQFKVTKTAGMEIDFKRLEDNFSDFRDELSRQAKMFVEPAELEGEPSMGLLLIRPQEAYGRTEVFVDPKLGNDVRVVTRGGRLYLSVNKNSKLYIRREDVTYPAKERGETEATTIIITDNPYAHTDVVKASSSSFLEQYPGLEWKERPRSRVGTPYASAAKQENFQTLDAYRRDYAAGTLPDRLESVDPAKIEEERTTYREVLASIETATIAESADITVRPTVLEKVQALINLKDSKKPKDKKEFQTLIDEFRSHSTQRFDLPEGKKSRFKDWSLDQHAAKIFIEKKIGIEPINADEFRAVYTMLMIESFQDLQSKGEKEAEKEYKDFLDNFHQPLLQEIFTKYFEKKDDPKAAEKAKECADWIIGEFKEIDITAPGKAVEAGTLFATLVGMRRITGLRAMYNFTDTAAKYGTIGELALDPKAPGIPGEVARFWIETLSPYRSGLGSLGMPPNDAENAVAFKSYQSMMRENLRSPLALKVMQVAAAAFTPAERRLLTSYYNTPSAEVTPENLATFQKLSAWVDAVRDLELKGENVELKLSEHISIQLDAKVFQAIYKRCGNPSGLLQEDFKAIIYYKGKKIGEAGMGEGVIDVATSEGRIDFVMRAGLIIPIIQRQEVGGPPRKGPPGKPTGPKPEIPTPVFRPRPVPPRDAARVQPDTEPAPGVENPGGSTTGRLPGDAVSEVPDEGGDGI